MTAGELELFLVTVISVATHTLDATLLKEVEGTVRSEVLGMSHVRTGTGELGDKSTGDKEDRKLLESADEDEDDERAEADDEEDEDEDLEDFYSALMRDESLPRVD